MHFSFVHIYGKTFGRFEYKKKIEFCFGSIRWVTHNQTTSKQICKKTKPFKEDDELKEDRRVSACYGSEDKPNSINLYKLSKSNFIIEELGYEKDY